MAERQEALARAILQDPAVESVSSFIGVDGVNTTLNNGRVFINLKPRSERGADVAEVMQRLQPRIARVQGISLYMQPVQDLTIEDRVSRTQYQLTVEDANPDELAVWVHRLVDRLRQLPQLADVASDLQDQGLQAFVSIDRDTSGRLGVTPAAVGAIEAEARALELPASLRTSFQGAALAFRASLANELLLILAAIVTMYIVLGVLYESYIDPLTILSTLPSAGVGALLALMLTKSDLGMSALIGIIPLIGIVKKNAIMMIDFALDAERKDGMSPRDAIYHACLLRFRPILMTTMSALLAALPL